ncbi:hypothetical protein AN958_01610 [Leucoagaricus sp. SymC.cos]|nr:hypothetical protein AN958_01610 [Leucoagaricus sp. SymC.cos]
MTNTHAHTYPSSHVLLCTHCAGPSNTTPQCGLSTPPSTSTETPHDDSINDHPILLAGDKPDPDPEDGPGGDPNPNNDPNGWYNDQELPNNNDFSFQAPHSTADRLPAAIEALAKSVRPSTPPTTTNKARVPKAFTGKDPLKLEIFLFQCSLYFHANSCSFPTDSNRVNLALTYLTGVALFWFQVSLHQEDQGIHHSWADSWPEISKEQMDVTPPPPSVPDCLPENAPVGEPSGTVPAPPPPKPQGLRKAKAKKAAEKQVLSKGPPPPVPSASKPGAQSFAAAARAAPTPVVGSSGSVENLVHVARSFPNLAPSAIVALLWADTAAAASAAPAPVAVAGAKHPITPSAPASPAKKPKATTKGPSRKQVLFVLDDPNARPNLEQMPCLLNKYLTDNKVVRLRAETVLVVYSGWSIQLTDVPSLEQLNTIRQWLGIHFSPIGSEVYLPASKSFLKLINVPYIRQDGSWTTSDQVEGVMRASNLSNHFVLVGPPQVVRNSKSSDTAMAYFEVWDSQRGTRAANLVGHSLQFGHWTSRVMEASANPGASLCQRCWRWGHSSQTCHQKMPRHTLPTQGSALSGITSLIRTGSATSIRRDLTRSAGGVIGDVRIFLQNVNKNYVHVDYVLENLKNTFDILFFQELPWRTIRQTVSTTSEGGNDVVGAPKHLDWLYMVRPPTNGQNPCVMAYVHRCLAVLRPSMRRDIIDHCDLFVLSLFTPRGTVNLLNIYSDDAHTAINLLSRDVDQLPAFIYMGGDFNCHSEVWDSSCTLHPLVTQHLLELASDVGLEWARPSNSGMTHIPHNPDLAGSVIDLVFMAPSVSVSDLPQLDLDQHARPGRRLLDCFGDHIWVVEFDSKEEDVNVLWILNAELDRAVALDDCIVAATDASVGRDRVFQVVSAAWVWAGGVLVWQSCQAAGRVTAPNAELHAIQMGVFAVCMQEGACHVVLFTDHPASARRAVDPSVGSRQAQALLVCRRLQRWLGEDPSRTFAFIQVHSSLEWPLHYVVHHFAMDPSFKVPVGDSPFMTLNYIRMAEAQACRDEWTRQFTSSSSSGRDFLHLTDVRSK